MYANGSLLPLYISKVEASEPFRFSFCERNIAKTDAASVDATIEPISNPSNNVVLNTKKQNTPVNPAVKTTPNVDKRIDGIATGLAILQLVPNPPKNIMNINATVAILLVN